MTIILTLTDREAESLQSILMNGVLWSSSGLLGDDAHSIYNALADVDVVESDKVKRAGRGDIPVWKDKR